MKVNNLLYLAVSAVLGFSLPVIADTTTDCYERCEDAYDACIKSGKSDGKCSMIKKKCTNSC